MRASRAATADMTRCRYCEQPAQLVDGTVIYPHRPDLAAKRFWACLPCSAWVGCHPGTEKPLGRLANAQLRAAKMAAHGIFDPLWKGGPMRRREAYRWLAGELGMEPKRCHIGYMDLTECQ